jgi:hypothetical protein
MDRQEREKCVMSKATRPVRLNAPSGLAVGQFVMFVAVVRQGAT